jgi:hypothetical protein
MARTTSQSAFTFLAILLLIPQLANAQETLIERLSEREAENNPAAENALMELLSQPLDANRLSREDLSLLPFLARTQIDGFLSQRKARGGFKNLDEALAALEVVGDTLALCREIFFVSPPKSGLNPRLATRWRIIRPATIDPVWLGAPYRAYERATLAAGEFSVGMLAERDPGERRLDDHRLFYGQWQRGAMEKSWQVLAGSYQIEWAQGLAFWGPYATTTSADVHAASRREGRGLLPYLSGDENAGLRGAAFAWRRSYFLLLAFISSQRLDVTLRDSATATNFYESGYHRTATELARRKTLHEHVAGATMKIKWRNRFEFGALAYRSRYDKNWIRSDFAAGYFDFTGQTNEVLDLFFSWTTSELKTNLEIAKSRSGGVAGSAVLSGEAASLRWTIESHYYARDFHSPHGRSASSFSEPPQNEFGYSFGISTRLRRGLTAELFAEKSQELWRTHTLPLPGSQLQTGIRLEWKMRRDLTMYLRWQQTREDEILTAKVASLSPTSGHPSSFISRDLIAPQFRQSGRWRLDYHASPKLRLTSRLDLAWQPHFETAPNRKPEVALALSEELRWVIRNRVVITGRYTLFAAPTDAPIYQYEHDLPGVFTSVALRERGRRAYIYVRYLSAFGFELSLKLAGTERECSIFDQIRSYSWGAQLDWRLSLDRL